MSVRPVLFHADGSVDVVYDELGHTGTLSAQQIVWATDQSGKPVPDAIRLDCPDGCGVSSMHPVGGGAAPPEVQELFVHKVQRDGCACGQVEAGRTDSVPEAHVHLACERQDGPDRWQLDSTAPRIEPLPGVLTAGPKSFQVIYRESDGLIVGLDPSGGVGPDLKVAVLHDMAEQDVLLNTDPAYLSANGDHVVATPR